MKYPNPESKQFLTYFQYNSPNKYSTSDNHFKSLSEVNNSPSRISAIENNHSTDTLEVENNHSTGTPEVENNHSTGTLEVENNHSTGTLER